MNYPKVGFVSLGCPKASVDSQNIINMLLAKGYQITNNYNDAKVVIVNTCGFINSAKAESLASIGDAILQNENVIVTGCMGINPNEITNAYPKVLSVTGPNQYETVINEVQKVAPLPDFDYKLDLTFTPISLTPPHYSYLKISEGCNNSCSFCIIPKLRGKLISRPISHILDEAKALVANGTKELLVIAQDTTAYGVDVKYRTDFYDGIPLKTNIQTLSDQLGKLGVWVRMHYVYPYPNVDTLIPLMKDGLILPYLDIPFQHASPNVLQNMKRPASDEKILERIQRWRDQVPDLAIRSTFITGFPGETDADFEYLLEWLEKAQLDRVGAFEYSEVECAASNNLDLEFVDEDTKANRYEILMQFCTSISAKKLAKKVGSKQETIVDEITSTGFIGRSKHDAPEIDGVVIVETNKQIKTGDIVQVNIKDSNEYDLYGVLV